MYIRIAFSIELRLRVSRSLRSLANYRPSPLAQKPSNDVLACGDPITPSNTVKYHTSSNTLISMEQRGGVRNKYIYIYIYIYMYIRIAFSIELRLRVSRSLRSLANKANFKATLKQNHFNFATSELQTRHRKAKEFELFLTSQPPTGSP